MGDLPITLKQIKIAYKKLKASVYYDKTQLVLRNAIVAYENQYDYNSKSIEERFSKIINILADPDDRNWKNYELDILNSIKILSFPKKLENIENNIIINKSPKIVNVEKLQHFIDINVEGQILGILWIMTIGKILDAEIYQHSYGNRLKKHTTKDNNKPPETDTSSPYLFQPYFLQYESWRDKALDIATEALDKKQNSIILTMDFSKFYYNVHISAKDSKSYYDAFTEKNSKNKSVERLNSFVYEVLKNYSQKYDDTNTEKVFLPIGFFPSNILSNYYLKNFDNEIVRRWNPLYYGRYVDDIIIVDKVEKNSPLYLEAKDGELTKDSVMQYFLCNCNADKSTPCGAKKKSGLLIEKTETKPSYTINPILLGNKVSDIAVNDDKINVFYFKESGSRSLLDGFRKALYKNTSEFRYLPEDDAVLVNNDYGEIFDLENTDTLNKLRGIKGITINKYALSKFLGKLMRIGQLIDDPKENQFNKDILTIFDAWKTIDNYTTWDKIIQILALNGNYAVMKRYIMSIVEAILNTQFQHKKNIALQQSLLRHLHSSLCRGLSLVWGNETRIFIKELYAEIKKSINKEISGGFSGGSFRYRYKIIKTYRKGYCYSRMCDKYALISCIDFIIRPEKNGKETSKLTHRKLSDKQNFNLTNINDFIQEATQFSFDKDYYFYPYIITPQDLSIAQLLAKIKSIDSNLTPNHTLEINPEEMNKRNQKDFIALNFPEGSPCVYKEIIVKKSLDKTTYGLDSYATKISTEKKKTFNIAIANIKMQSSDFINALEGKPNRIYNKYKDLSHLFNNALCEKADMLIFPESYLPLDWLPIVARTCAKNQLALVTGIEHFIYKGYVFNFTATILPYTKDDFRFAHITYHLKVHYSPEEERQIKGYNLQPVMGKTYDLFNWQDLWFTVYCCFELASISDRSLFNNYPDLIVAVEWNKDTNYFSNIIESLCRDIHCYCAQVNSSDWGDSRILQPSESVKRDILKTKGGLNSTILVANVDIHKLRSFQRKEYELQKDSKIFKPTPPQFNKDTIRKKINGVLWDEIVKKKQP